MIELTLDRPRILPPKGLLLALGSQVPLLVAGMPLRPPAIDVAAGAIFLLAGAVLNVWAERLFRRSGVGVCPFTRVPMLVDRGPYRIMRNPMYLGLVCLNAGFALMTGVRANVWSSIAYAIWLHYAFVRPEEAFLKQELGARFDEYARRVPRWLPLRSF
jgi:protein-S-isoprenylcysteine O-methyltransferase Ste14